jgi:hypothetical protein
MADDSNNPMNKKPTAAETAAAIFKGIDYKNIPVDVSRNIARAGQLTQEHSNLAADIARMQQSQQYKTHQQFPGQFAGTAFGNQIDAVVNGISTKVQRQEEIETGQAKRGMNTNERLIGRHFDPSHIRGEAERRMYNPEVQRRMLMEASSVTPNQARSQMNASNLRMEGIRGDISNLNQKMFSAGASVSPADQRQLDALYGKRNEELNTQSFYSGVTKSHKAAGIDDLSVTMGRLQMQRQAENVIANKGAGADSAAELLAALKRLSAEVDNTTNSYKDADAAVKKSGEKFISDSGGGGGHTVLGMGAKGWGRAAAIGQIMSTLGSGITTLGVDHRIKERQVMTGFANLANSKYDMYKNARDGDVASQMAMTQWGNADKFANQVKQTARAGEIASGVGDLIVGGVKTAGAVMLGKAAVAAGATGLGLPIAAGLGTGAAALGVSAATDFAVAGSSFFRGIKGGQAYIDATNTHMEAMKAVNAIPAEQYQGLRDMYTGAGGVARNMGSRGGNFLNEITQSGPGSLLNDLSAARMSPEQYVQMAGLGNDMMGSMFDKKQIFGARSLEVAGLGTVEQNMKRQGALAASGSNNPLSSLESVMASAMTKGLDSSKALDMMVTNTAAIVSQTGAAAAGIDTTAVTAAALATMVDPNIANKEFATERAKTIADIARSAETNVSTTYSGMVNTSRISAATGLSGIDAITAGEMTGAEWKALEGDPDAEKKLRSMGISVGAGGGAKMVATMIRLKQRQVAEGEGAANAMGGMSDSLFEKLRNGTLTEKDPEYDQAADIARRSKYKTVEEYQRAVQSGDTNVVSKDTLKDKVKSADSSELGKIDKLMTGQMARLADQANVAAEGLKKLGDALSLKGGPLQRFIEGQEAAEKDGRQQEREAATMAANAAKDFNLAASNLNSGSSAFKQIMDKVADKLNITVKAPADDKTVATGRGDTSGRRRPGEF